MVAKKLQDIPFGVLRPTLIYGGGGVYSIGGYELNSNLSKFISDKMFFFDYKFKAWYLKY